MAVKAYCDRCDAQIPDDDENCRYLEACEVTDDWKAEGSLNVVALLCGTCLAFVVDFATTDPRNLETP